MVIKSVDNDSSSILHYSVCVTDDFRRTRIIRRDTILKMMKHLRKVIYNNLNLLQAVDLQYLQQCRLPRHSIL